MIIKITPDKEKAKAVSKMAEDRLDFIKRIDIKKFPTITAESYYEAIKELITSLMLIDGFKATGEGAHKDIVEYLKNYKEFSDNEVYLADDLRKKRNYSLYERKEFQIEYINKNKLLFEEIIIKLKKSLEMHLKTKKM